MMLMPQLLQHLPGQLDRTSKYAQDLLVTCWNHQSRYDMLGNKRELCCRYISSVVQHYHTITLLNCSLA